MQYSPRPLDGKLAVITGASRGESVSHYKIHEESEAVGMSEQARERGKGGKEILTQHQIPQASAAQ